MDNYKHKVKSFDYLIIFYCLVTGIYITFGSDKLDNIFLHIALRLLIILVSLAFVSLDHSKNKTVQFFRNFYPLIFLGFFYSETDYYNNIIFNNFDPLLINLEQYLFGTQPSIKFSQWISNRWFSEIMHFSYFSYYLLTFGIPLLFYLKKRDQFAKLMFIIVFSFCIYYLVFAIFPSIGPQFYFDKQNIIVPKGYLFYKIMHIIVAHAETETGAFPSSHVGIAIIYIILVMKYFRKYIIGILIISLFLMLSTVYIKAHYLIDVIAGILSGIIIYFISNKTYDLIYPSTKQKNNIIS